MMLIALMFAQAATAAAPAAAPAKGQLPTAKVECRNIIETGSRVPKRICRLDKEWELLAQDAQDDLRNARDHRNGRNSL